MQEKSGDTSFLQDTGHIRGFSFIKEENPQEDRMTLTLKMRTKVSKDDGQKRRAKK